VTSTAQSFRLCAWVEAYDAGPSSAEGIGTGSATRRRSVAELRVYWVGTSTICAAGARALPCGSLLGVNIGTSLDSRAGPTKMMCGASNVPVSTDRPDRHVGAAGPAALWTGTFGGVASSAGVQTSSLVSPGVSTWSGSSVSPPRMSLSTCKRP